MERIFGLIGYPITHSFSPEYFREKFLQLGLADATYRLFPMQDLKKVREVFNEMNIAGLNVTIPHKQTICKYLDTLSPEAIDTGAVNTIEIRNGNWIGHNTDIYGFRTSLLHFIESPASINNALILGDGGAAQAVKYVLKELGISYLTISRKKGNLSYDQLQKRHIDTHHLIINTTPLGMFPNSEGCPSIPYEFLGPAHFLFDLIYNPEKTLFLANGSDRHCKIKNGSEMLTLQADRAWEIWNQT